MGSAWRLLCFQTLTLGRNIWRLPLRLHETWSQQVPDEVRSKRSWSKRQFSRMNSA